MPATGVTIDFLNRIQTTKNREDLAELLQQAAARFGYLAFAISHYDVKDGQDRVDVLLHRLPPGFGQRAIAQNYGNRNPVTRRARASDEPFFLHEATYDPSAEPDAGKVMEDAASVGLIDGYCIPVHVPEGGRGLVSFLGRPVTLSEEDRLALRALGLAAHAQVLHLGVSQARTAKLTAREREVLRWTAAGKTADATAAILSISVRTVEYHLLNAARKLNTANRTHTVVEALRSKQLSL